VLFRTDICSQNIIVTSLLQSSTAITRGIQGFTECPDRSRACESRILSTSTTTPDKDDLASGDTKHGLVLSNEMRCTSLTNPTSRLQPKPSCCRTYVESGASNVGNSQLPIPRPQSTIHEYVPLVFAKFKIRSLLKWADGLPPERHRQTGMLHNVAEVQ
jgi:hypothetical protein